MTFSSTPAEHSPLTPPLAARRPVTRTHHGIDVVDELDWLRDKTNPEVIEHLTKENEYTQALTAEQQPLRDEIFEEIKSHVVETDLSVPTRRDGWWYFARTTEGAAYPAYCRVPAKNTGDDDADWTPPQIQPDSTLAHEEVVLDGNIEAANVPFFALGGMSVSPDGNLLAYLVDESGDEYFTLRIRDLRTGDNLADEITGLAHGVFFDRTSTRVFYTIPDATWRPYQIKAHTVGTEASADVLINEESDPGIWSGFGLSADRGQLIIGVGNSEVTETSVVDIPEDPAEPLGEPRVLISRDKQSLHEVDSMVLNGERTYFMVHNRDYAVVDDSAAESRMPSFRLSMATEATIVDPAQWRTVIEHDPAVRLDSFTLTKTHLTVEARQNTVLKVMVYPLEGIGTENQSAPAEPNFAEELYTSQIAAESFDSPFIRLSYESWITPSLVLDYQTTTGQLALRKQTPVRNYQPQDYLVERWWAPAESSDPRVRIPLTVIRHKDIEWDGNNPCLVYGYGSYEVSMDPYFAATRLPLLERGVVYVVAHVRGGGELGRHWYENGKKLTKKNSFTDFVDATRFVAASGWVHPDRISCMGGSAGGLLMGAVVNLAPELYRACVAQVPFVDALTSILDPDLPLSALEWEEWGNPIEDADVYRYMSEYTPYENIRATEYPAIAAVTSLNDTRVMYAEPAKWVQKLRETVTSPANISLAKGGSPIVLKTEMDGGHGGASGRYESWKDRAWDYAFVLQAMDATERKFSSENSVAL